MSSSEEYKIQRISFEKTWPIRHRVMWPDQAIDYVVLEHDQQGEHFGVLKTVRLISVIYLFITGNKAQFRKFATEQQEQGKGYGSQLLNYLIKYARTQNISILWCNARKDKIAYYQKFGFQLTEQTFSKGGLAYIVLEKHL